MMERTYWRGKHIPVLRANALQPGAVVAMLKAFVGNDETAPQYIVAELPRNARPAFSDWVKAHTLLAVRYRKPPMDFDSFRFTTVEISPQGLMDLL